jgi:outer membrane receptor protein involved in Fe transport
MAGTNDCSGKLRWRALAALIATFYAWQAGAQAPTSATAAAQSTQDANALDAIVVTAERRSERLQDVPISIANIGAAQLQQANVLNLGDIVALTPGVRFDYGGTIVQPTIRLAEHRSHHQ